MARSLPQVPYQTPVSSKNHDDNLSSSNPCFGSTLASSKAIAFSDVSEVGGPTRDNLDVAKFLVSNAKTLSLSNDEMFVKSVECVLNPVYNLFGCNKKGFSGGTTNDDLMPGCGSSTIGEGMPFGGSFASLISDVPNSIELNDRQEHGFTEVKRLEFEEGNDTEFCQNDSLVEAVSGFCGETTQNVVTIEGTSVGI